MHVLILEDDVIMQELLAVIIRDLDPTAQIRAAESIEAGLALWHREPISLLLCDLSLPGTKNGLDLVKAVRAENPTVPIVMISGRGDRSTVINSLQHRVNEFIVKPFIPQQVAERLRRYIPAPEAKDSRTPHDIPGDLEQWLQTSEGLLERLTVMSGSQSALTLLNASSKPSASELARLWENDPAITISLVRLANGHAMRHYGKSVTSLLQAIGMMGVEMAISQVMAASLSNEERLKHPYLKQLASQFAEESRSLADQAAGLAKLLKLDIAVSYTAGLMARMGESVLLDAIQQFLSAGGKATISDIDRALDLQAANFSHQLKQRWHLPMTLRDRIGAVYHLPDGSMVRKDLILMRVAGMIVHKQTESESFERLISLLGIGAKHMESIRATLPTQIATGPGKSLQQASP